MLHIGHILLFKHAKELGDRLIVAVQDGDYILKYKPGTQMVYSSEERMYMVSMYKLQKIYHSNVMVKRTDNLAVEVSVMDSDPQWAADIANFIVDYYDTLSRTVQRERAYNAFQLMSETQKVLSADIRV